jgi:hypothetical protein
MKTWRRRSGASQQTLSKELRQVEVKGADYVARSASILMAGRGVNCSSLSNRPDYFSCVAMAHRMPSIKCVR